MALEGITASGRNMTSAAAITALAASFLVVAASTPAGAAAFTASNGAEFVAAVDDAGENPGPDTITLTADFEFSEPSPAMYGGSDELTIDGDGHTVTVNTESGLFWTASVAPEELTFTNLTISGSSLGSAISVEADTLVTLSYVTITDYLSVAPAISIAADTVNVVDSRLDYARSDSDGGALYVTGDMLTVTDSVFENNVASGDGGAVAADVSGDVIIEGSRFYNNEAGNAGGALWAEGFLEVRSSVFDNNQVDDDGSGGGAIWAPDTARIESSTFVANESGDVAGAVFSAGSIYTTTTVFDSNEADGSGGAIYAVVYSDNYGSTFVGNTSGSLGGAIYTEGEDYSQQWESTFSGNSATVGGAIATAGNELRLFFSTLASNEAAADGGQAAHAFAAGELVTFGSIFTDAIGQAGCYGDDVTSQGGSVDVDGSCTAGWSGPADVADADGKLGPLGDNGGPTPTRVPSAGSAAIDRIDAETCFAFIGEYFEGDFSEADLEDLEAGENVPAQADADQRGVSRVEVFLGQGGGCDAGAVETFGPVTFEITGPSGVQHFTATGAIAVACPESVAVTDSSGSLPSGVAFPHGAAAFCLLLPWSGGSVTIVADLPSPANSAWKTSGDAWVPVTGATFSQGGTRVTYVVTDGGSLDQDGTVDRVIEDPIAFGIGAVFAG